ncbi:aminotransferase, class 4 [Variovorax paradoxus B4]|uniref:branched-chain-amino-acid transaminase n=1 Tax=Variovorax paradoxus B4 TaxID=1246301 RepID=T1XIY1_VARPD|nr:aminotransferase class IV [Variovorax paradoxus]7Z79_A Chain A, Aminotransferase, class 4 [Variovorax paradoxus B4]7Z79_B Chain B, Aminotransferase, class 4 [Variovorax paradoxus B4]7Z79_C Chain C, Aminotransferase, class 4 [Variovorax paradoxus B4]7Z79_D Chain D, Aminotransferase, class 4 [Variovorax paradoxus B4]7Z79_E Chain E, Aminotransferase, class 4 [Variovorax paradoxus B4]7Z79_F Chain F, Aminotransferase, class 4 [Variovorax paradoxus B4]AGU52506.1 aminotransferase, class 4 [Vario
MHADSAPSTTSSQAYAPDARNDAVLVYVNGQFVPRHQAVVSVFDAGYVCGDGVWEGVRLVDGRIVSFDAHIDRMYEGAKSIALDIGMTRAQTKQVVVDTFLRNGMRDGAHARLMVTRGVKKTPNQDPRFIIGGATVVCVAEHKVVTPEAKRNGLKLFTSTLRCSGPDVFDLRLNSHSRLNLIQALIQAIQAGADEALMLDPNGFVSSCNSTNFFAVRNGALWTSSGRYCFNGITRATVVRLAREAGIPVHEGDFTLAEVYAADEAFVTGTLAGLTPVSSVDGRALVPLGPLTQRLDALYRAYIASANEAHGALPAAA